MPDFNDILNTIVENDTEEEIEKDSDSVKEETENSENDKQREETEDSQDESDAGYDARGFDGTVSNSIGRGAVENLIKNTVFYLNGFYDSQHTDIRITEVPFEVKVN